MNLLIEDLRWLVDGRAILRDVGLRLEEGEFVGLIGPNGSGKSSLLRCIYRALEPQVGYIALGDEDIWQMSIRDLARRNAVVLQETPADFDFTVEEIVMMGRAPFKGPFDLDSDEDQRHAREALAQVEMTGFADRRFHTLSGGEKQRILIARALAQQARFLTLDEPTNHLDIRYQLEILQLLRDLGITTFAALHDLNLAALFCDRIYLLSEGEIVASGAPEAVLTPERIAAAYGVHVDVRVHAPTGKLNIIYFRSIPHGGDQLTLPI